MTLCYCDIFQSLLNDGDQGNHRKAREKNPKAMCSLGAKCSQNLVVGMTTNEIKSLCTKGEKKCDAFNMPLLWLWFTSQLNWKPIKQLLFFFFFYRPPTTSIWMQQTILRAPSLPILELPWKVSCRVSESLLYDSSLLRLVTKLSAEKLCASSGGWPEEWLKSDRRKRRSGRTNVTTSCHTFSSCRSVTAAPPFTIWLIISSRL